MNGTISQVADLVQQIQKCTEHLPGQYVEKIEELCVAVLSVTAMAEGAHAHTVNLSDISTDVDGVYNINGVKITIIDDNISTELN